MNNTWNDIGGASALHGSPDYFLASISLYSHWRIEPIIDRCMSTAYAQYSYFMFGL